MRRRIDSPGQESLQARPILVQDAQGRVPRVRDRARLLEDPFEHQLEIELANQRPTDVEQAPQNPSCWEVFTGPIAAP